MPNPFNAIRLYLSLLLICMLLPLTSCAKNGLNPPSGLSAAEYRQLAFQSVYEKRYADGAKLLQEAIKQDPKSEDFLLLADLQEVLGQYKQARSSYKKGLANEPADELKQTLIFHWATIEMMEFDNLEKSAELSAQLTEESAASHNLKALRAIETHQYDTALRLTEQAANGPASQEMKGWAHFHAARIWIALNNQKKAYHALFLAINHARGHSLVKRITGLWEDLKDQPQQVD